jgi:hypothetical protein
VNVGVGSLINFLPFLPMHTGIWNKILGIC